eukprot:COSAG01_NODE_60151_length_296_cov_0.786802_1_plen_47_part_10
MDSLASNFAPNATANNERMCTFDANSGPVLHSAFVHGTQASAWSRVT